MQSKSDQQRFFELYKRKRLNKIVEDISNTITTEDLNDLKQKLKELKKIKYVKDQ